jgi:hypothetical protein
VEGLLDFYQAYMPKEDFQYLCFALMSFMMGDEAGDYGQQFEMPPGFVARLIALTHNWLNLSGADPADLAAPLSWILPPHLALPLGAALTGPLAVVYNRLPATGYQTIPRDFTEETKAMLLYLVYEVHDEPWWEVTRWDVWYRVEKFFGGVDFVGHGQGLMDYYRKIIDMQDVTAVRVNEIFQQVGEADRQYAAHLNAQADAIETLTALTRDLANTFLAPPAQPPRPPTPIAPDKPPE